MGQFDLALQRLNARALEDREALGAKILALLDQTGEDSLSEADWAEMPARLDDGDDLIAHDDVVAAFGQKFRA